MPGSVGRSVYGTGQRWVATDWLLAERAREAECPAGRQAGRQGGREAFVCMYVWLLLQCAA